MAGLAIANVKNNFILGVNFNINQCPRNLAKSGILVAFIMSARTRSYYVRYGQGSKKIFTRMLTSAKNAI